MMTDDSDSPMNRARNQTTVRRLRPVRRRLARTLRPDLVDLRARKPIWRARFLRCGRNVGCMMEDEKEDKDHRTLPRV